MHGRRDGKKYKHWLLTRGRRDVDTVQSGVMLLIRNVVREWVRDAYPQTAELSLQQIIRSKKTLEQLLPSSAPDQRSSEQTDWLTQKLSSDLAKMDSIEQVVLLLRAQGRVFSAPGIQAEFGVGKTTLHKYHRQILEREAAELSDHFPGLSVEDASALVLDLLDGWGKQLFSNFLAENTGTPAFKKVKEPEDA
jgi:hypothetical protein